MTTKRISAQLRHASSWVASVILKRKFIFHLVMLLLSMLIGGMTTVRLGQDVNYDLHNYHYYNPHAFLNGSNPMKDGIAVGGILSYENPIRDVPAYLLMDNLSPKKAGFIIGAFQALNIWLVFEIALLFLRRLKTNHYTKFAVALAISGFSLLGSGFHSELGTTMGDNTTSILVLLAVFLLLRSYQAPMYWRGIDINKSLAFLSIGASAGLKLTNLTFVLGLLAADIAVNLHLSLKYSLKRVALNMLSIAAGLVLTGGYWFVKMWLSFGNPIFPFYNALFKSEYYPVENFVDDRWINAPLWKAIIEPFYYIKNQAISSEMYFADPRLALVISGILLVVAACIIRRKQQSPALNKHWTREAKALFIFAIVSYVFWAVQFSYYRYIITLELLSLVVVFVSLLVLIRSLRNVLAAFSVILVFVLLTTIHTSWGRIPWQSTNFGVSTSNFRHLESATVLIAGTAPYSFLVSYFPESSQTIRVGSNVSSPSFGTEKMRTTIREGLDKRRQHRVNTFAVIADEERKSAEETFRYYGFRIADCEEIPITVRMHIESKYRLCKLQAI